MNNSSHYVAKDLAYANREKNEFSECETNEFLIPPFLGEIGAEVQFFLAAVEPWLRSGWKIFAKRPQLYPPGTAIYDKKLFEDIADLSNSYGARPLMCKLALPNPLEVQWRGNQLEDGAVALQANLAANTINSSFRASDFEKKLKAIVGRRVLHKTRPLCLWDDYLTSLYASNDDIAAGSIQRPIVPSYLPHHYISDEAVLPDHIGVQLRKYGDPIRDSNVNLVLDSVREASKILGLPVIVYGHKSGTILPEGIPSTWYLSEQSNLELLEFELKALKNCSLMFAPLSGWADLMAWLRVPTIVEGIVDNGVLARLNVFKPKMLWLDKRLSTQQLINNLFSARTSVAIGVTEPHPIYKPSGFTNKSFF